MKINLEAIISDSNLINSILILSSVACFITDSSFVLPVSILAFKLTKDVIEVFKTHLDTKAKSIDVSSKLEELETKIGHLSSKDAAKEMYNQLGKR